jgi:chromosome segregation ATPase
MEFDKINIKQMVLNKDSDGLSVLEDEWDVKIKDADECLQVVEQRILQVEKECIDLRDNLSDKKKELKDLESAASKGRHNLRRMTSEKKTINKNFWRAK